VPGRAANPASAAAAATVRPDFILLDKDLLEANISTRPLGLVLLVSSRNALKKGSRRLGFFG
jgi:hypothetical protein